MTEASALAIYAANTDVLATRYDGVATETVLAGLLDLIPPPPAQVLECREGSLRCAALSAFRALPEVPEGCLGPAPRR